VWRLKNIAAAEQAISRLPKDVDRHLLTTLIGLLPHLIQTIAMQGGISQEAASSWYLGPQP
ncbi:MAG: hypothetical protein WCP77_15185, partial [Roseococcus sp.]